MGPEWRLACYDTLPSTNDFCIAEAEAGAPEGLAVLARSQSRPRGSRGRSWNQAGGTLAISVLLRRDAAPLWPFLAALAFHDALGLTSAHAEAIRLKWPNDLMLHGRKFGGILIETGLQPGAGGWLVIGFGANLAEAPALADRQAACLAELGPVPSADVIAERLLAALSRWIAAGGMPHIRREWLARAHPPGTLLAVQTPQGQITGSFSSITEEGILLLTVDGGLRHISTGEVLALQGA